MGIPEKTSTSASLTRWKLLTVWITTNWKFLKRWEYQITLPVSWEICIWVKKQQLEQDMEQQTGSKLWKESDKGVYYHPAYLTYMQSTSCKMPDCIHHKLESRFLGEISTISDCSDMQLISLTAEKWKWKSLSCVQLLATPWTISPWNSPGQNPGVGSHSLLQGIFPTQESNPDLLHCRQILYQLSHQRSPRILEWVAYPLSRGSFQPRIQTRVSCSAGRFFTS